jgi:septal ring factor EnvC (AmiA/AmiB activator)
MSTATLPSQLPTKEQEIAHYRAFVDALPRASYLRGILGETVDAVEELIRNDHAFVEPLYSVWRSLAESEQRVAELRKAESEARRALQRAESALDRKRNELRDLANRADLIGRKIREAVPTSP